MDISNAFLSQYLEYVEDTESPRTFHIWSVISAVGACLGRRAFLPFGAGQIFANNYILLVGPPGVRKSSAINTVQGFLRRAGRIRFAPTDTGGQRQGLIKAMVGDDPEAEGKRKEATPEYEAIQNILKGNASIEGLNDITMNIADMHAMYVCASEYATFIGINCLDMITFLTKMWDGEDYDYKTKNDFTTLTDPLLSILGGATPSVIAQSLPANAMGGGFMSRKLLIYANKKHKHIAFPAKPSTTLQKIIIKGFRDITDSCSGPFELDQHAKNLLTALYDYQVPITDPRFVYYMERRFSHLLKTTIAIAALRKDMRIISEDAHLAHLFLSEAEKSMVDALGEYGLSPLGAAKQKLLEFIQYSHPAPVPLMTIMAMLKRDMKPIDITNSLMDLCNSNSVKRLTTDYGDAYIYNEKKDKIKAMVLDSLLAEVANG